MVVEQRSRRRRVRSATTRAVAALSAAVFAICGLTDRVLATGDFYAGKTINLIVGYGPGGGYDIYARLVARTMARHIRGQPTIVIQNMPGAGSLVATNYLYRIAPRDGTVFGTFARNMPLVGLMGSRQSVQFDPTRFTWLGSSSSFQNDAYVLLVRKAAGVSSIAETRLPNGKQLVIGSTAEGSSSDTMPTVLRELLGLNIKSIGGYRDSGQLFLAMERGEIDGRMVGLSAIKSNKPEWLLPESPMTVLLAAGRSERLASLPIVPTAREYTLGTTERHLLEAIELPYLLARPFAAPPGIPAGRARILQAAFAASHADPILLQEAEKLGIDISPIGAEEVLNLIKRVAATPSDRFKAIERLVEGK